MTDKTG